VTQPQARLLLISGSTRSGSSNTAALRTLAHLAPADVDARLYEELSKLPAFNPDTERTALPAVVASLREQIAAAGAVVFCTPEYAGGMPGSLKNLLDWTVGGTDLNDKPAAWINVAAAGRGTGAQDALITVLRYVSAALIEPACRCIPLPPGSAGPDGLVTDPDSVTELRAVLDSVLAAVAATPPAEGASTVS
jgi:chromate reductase